MLRVGGLHGSGLVICVTPSVLLTLREVGPVILMIGKGKRVYSRTLVSFPFGNSLISWVLLKNLISDYTRINCSRLKKEKSPLPLNFRSIFVNTLCLIQSEHIEFSSHI